MRVALPMAGVLLSGALAMAAIDYTTDLQGEPGPVGAAPDTSTLATPGSLAALVQELAELVTAVEAAQSFVAPEDLPDLSDAVPLDELPDVGLWATAAELAAGFVPAGQVPDLAAYLSSTEASSLYLPYAAVPAQDQLVTAADLPDLSAYPTAAELAASTFTKAQITSKMVSKASADASFVPLDGPLPVELEDEVRAIIAARIAAQACPAGMAAVADFCIDVVEASVWDAPCPTGGPGGSQLGLTSDDYGPGFPDSGAFSQPRFACAVVGAKPSRYLTWFQAQQACALSGKRLCRDAEWQLAALGTPDAQCATSGAAVVATGSKAACLSDFGVRDMIGNAREMVAELQQAGPYWKNTNGEATTDWPAGYGDGQDTVRGVNGLTAEPQKAGLPAMTLRGGSYTDGAAAGAFAISLDAAPTLADERTGFRCCRSMR